MATSRRVVTALILLPTFYNPDAAGNRHAIEDEKFMQTATEVSELLQEGGILHLSRESPPAGFWWNRGVVETDVLAILEVDMEDTEENRNRLESYAKGVLLGRFQQEAIYIKFVTPIERMLVRTREVK
jgi:hypothetical protein